ncbi:hypothetical protein LG634_26405 [Streptomyces bambusae]|uniref:hypothetical protein n=1 Tax=Streptomyces bambusae TaxID=1550616 RepID=UPI001CFECF14|nr:hypothetical protein [Streptomyces bambusae]MCB5168343.1 hypothetical protein [Streptomyces bambusae]
MTSHPTVKRTPATRLRQTAAAAWSEPLARTYLVLVAGCALWAVAGGAGLGDAAWLPRQTVVILTLPFFLVVHLLLAATEIDHLLLGHSFYTDSPAWLFEPLYLLYVAVAGLLGARFLAAWTRSFRTSGTPPWVVPVSCALFVLGAFALWHL